MRKSVCFAYFGDNQFLGWYADTFGSVRTSPKVYGNSESQLQTITKNFRNKLTNVRTDSKNYMVEVVRRHNAVGGAILDIGLSGDAKLLSQYTNVELRVVECPYYDGPNPDFDKEAWEVESTHRRAVFNKELAEYGATETSGKERGDFIRAFDERHPELNIRPETWVYCDYSKVKEWAKDEPTEFLSVIETV